MNAPLPAGFDDGTGRARPKGATMLCPHCDSIARVVSSEGVSPTVRTVYYACPLVTCGHTWQAQLAFVHTISPSGCPRPGLDLPIRTPVRRIATGPPDDEDDPDQLKMFA